MLLYSTTIYAVTGVDSVTVKVDETIISPVDPDGNTYWIDKGNNPTVEATAKPGYFIKSGTGNTGIIDAAKTVDIASALSTDYALKFSSDDDFTLSGSYIGQDGNLYKGWNGTLQYSTDSGSSWTTWDGSQLSGTATQPIYLRGIGNTRIAGSYSDKWEFTGKYCTGNIETLLDYKTVIKGQHPTMTSDCYAFMFYTCRSLVTPPELPAITLTEECYYYMFYGCKSLTTAPELPATILTDHCYLLMFGDCTSLETAPELPATTLAEYCYGNMFSGCTSLTTAPSLPAKTLADHCYYEMFEGCTSLTTVPELPATILADHCYAFMFYKCTSLKLSYTKTDIYQYAYRIPKTGTGTMTEDALNGMFSHTVDNYNWTPHINTTYYTDHKPV